MKKYHYSNAQVCKSGHIISSNIDTSPNEKKTFCPTCGAKTITQCPHCQSNIQGNYYAEKIVQRSYDSLYASTSDLFDSLPVQVSSVKIADMELPAYCYNCGQPFPWTESLLNTADEIVELSDFLTDEQKEQLKKCFPNLITDTIESNIAAIKFSKLFAKLEPFAKESLKNLLLEYISDAILVMLGWKSS